MRAGQRLALDGSKARRTQHILYLRHRISSSPMRSRQQGQIETGILGTVVRQKLQNKKLPGLLQRVSNAFHQERDLRRIEWVKATRENGGIKLQPEGHSQKISRNILISGSKI